MGAERVAPVHDIQRDGRYEVRATYALANGWGGGRGAAASQPACARQVEVGSTSADSLSLLQDLLQSYSPRATMNIKSSFYYVVMWVASFAAFLKCRTIGVS